MANTLLTIGMITNEALVVLKNNLTFTKHVNREYDDQFGRAGAKIGDTLNLRKPVRYQARTTAAVNVQNSTETSVPLTLNKQYGVDLAFTSADMALSVDEFSDRFIKPAVIQVSNKIDYDGMAQYVNVWNTVGTPGTTPNSLLTYLDAGVKLDNNGAPMDDLRSVIVNPRAQATLVNALTNVFNPTKEISDQYKDGTMGRAAGFKWSMDQNVNTQTVGTYAANVAGGAVTVTTTVSSGNTIVTGGWTAADFLNVGDVITFSGVNAVNPQNYQSTGEAAQFVVTALATADGGGAMTITVSPAIVTTGAFKNVSGSILAGATLSVYGLSGKVTPQNLAFHRDAFTFGTCDLPIVGGVDMCKRVSSRDLGMSIRLTRYYTGDTDQLTTRLDLLGGWCTMRPELAVRVCG